MFNSPASKTQRVIGWVIVSLVTALFLSSAYAKLAAIPMVVEGFTQGGLGGYIQVIGIIEVIVLLAYFIPLTTGVGTLLAVGYLGGATLFHIITGQPFYFPVLIGIVAVIGSVLRNPVGYHWLLNGDEPQGTLYRSSLAWKVAYWVLAVIPSALLLVGGIHTLMDGKAVMPLGPQGIPAILLEVLCFTIPVLFLIPRTKTLGLLLLTGYLGGALVAHFELHNSFAPPIIAGLLAWAAGYIRVPALFTRKE